MITKRSVFQLEDPGAACSCRPGIFVWHTDRSAAGTVRTASGTTRPSAEFDCAGEFEAVSVKIHFHGLNLVQKFLVYDIFESVDFKYIVRVLRLVQSHGEARAASSALVQKNSNRGYVLILEIFGDLCRRRFRDFKHYVLLGMECECFSHY